MKNPFDQIIKEKKNRKKEKEHMEEERSASLKQ